LISNTLTYFKFGPQSAQDQKATARRPAVLLPAPLIYQFWRLQWKEIDGIGDTARQAGIRTIVPKSEVWSLIPNIESIVNQQVS
jgi:hypothetical protein